jgi:fucose 4-O-acetylase-like acetyltransferase
VPRIGRLTEASARNQKADVIKGIAILLVVLGHAIEANDGAFDKNILFRLIYSFHMPLFMVVSGWFARPEEPARLKRDAVRLLVPTATWYMVQFFVSGQYAVMSLGAYILMWIKAPDNGLWFLWILFLCHAVLCLARICERAAGLKSYAIWAALLWVIPAPYLGIQLLRFNFGFFAAGYLIARHWDAIKRFRTPALIASAAAWPIAFHFWTRVAPVGSGMRIAVFSHWVYASTVEFGVAHFASPVLGTVLFCWLCSLLSWKYFVAPASWFGRRTLEIYASHQLFLHIKLGTGSWAIVSTFLVALFGSLAVAEILQYNSLARLIFFGRLQSAARRGAVNPQRNELTKSEAE